MNCGLPRTVNDAIAHAARSTPAHSTASIGDSRCRFLAPEADGSKAGSAAGSRNGSGPWLSAGLPPSRPNAASATGRKSSKRAHDGYRRHFGLSHERRWRPQRAARGSRPGPVPLRPGCSRRSGSRDPLSPRARHQAEPRADRADDRPGDAQPRSGISRRASGEGLARGQRLLLGHRRSPADAADRAPGPPGRNAEPRLALRAGRDDRRGQRAAEPGRSGAGERSSNVSLGATQRPRPRSGA